MVSPGRGISLRPFDMKFSVVAAALLPLAYGFSKEDYDSGRVMAKMMAAKEVSISFHDTLASKTDKI